MVLVNIDILKLKIMEKLWLVLHHLQLSQKQAQATFLKLEAKQEAEEQAAIEKANETMLAMQKFYT